MSFRHLMVDLFVTLQTEPIAASEKALHPAQDGGSEASEEVIDAECIRQLRAGLERARQTWKPMKFSVEENQAIWASYKATVAKLLGRTD